MFIALYVHIYCDIQNYFLSNHPQHYLIVSCVKCLDFWSLKKECSFKQNCVVFLRFDFCTAIIFIVFTFQSKSLQNDASVLFSPPSIIKDTLPEEILEEMKSPPKQENKVCKKKTPKQALKPPPFPKKKTKKENPFNMHIKISVFPPLILSFLIMRV